jgi:CMP-N,N'-diacetyllegionaminic acid synthase
VIFVFDLDGTLCATKGRMYHEAEPIQQRIDAVNALFDQGHIIMVDTARGSMTGEDHRELTETQLEVWGLKYHELRVGVKLYADCYVDDKAAPAEEFFACES